MGYKRIGQVAHNISHSFLSLMNYDDGYIIDIIQDIMTKTPLLEFDFFNSKISGYDDIPAKLKKSLSNYKSWLNRMISEENLNGKVLELKLKIIGRGNYLEKIVFVKDDRGVEQNIPIIQTQL